MTMSRFSEYFKRNYPFFKEDVLQGRYNTAVETYVLAQHHRVEGKKDQTNINQIFTAAFDGFSRNGSKRLQDLKEWIGDDEAFEGFYQFFNRRYGKGGQYRVSNKKKKKKTVSVKTGESTEIPEFKEQLDSFLKKLSKNRYYDKKWAFEETKRYILRVVFPQWSKKYIDNFKKRLAGIKEQLDRIVMDFVEYCSLDYSFYVERYRWWAERNDFYSRIMSRCFWDYMCWHSARYINRKRIPGERIPTNKLTKAVKNDPYAYKFMDLKEKRALLRSFRYQKSLSRVEIDNAEDLYLDIFEYYYENEEINWPWEVKLPAALDKVQELYAYWKKAYSFLETAPVKDLDELYSNAVEKILAYKTPFQRITPQQKTFIDALPMVDIKDKKEYTKTIDRMIGVFTFCTRIKFMKRGDYYYRYFDSIVPNGKLEFWEEWRNKGLDVFMMPKCDKTFYNFNTRRYVKYVSYIDAVKKLYPMDKYQYIYVDYLDRYESSSDTYYTGKGYTLARYDANGKLSHFPLEGNYVRKLI